MALRMITFLGKPNYLQEDEGAGSPPRYRLAAYDFGEGYLSRQTPIFGLALFEYLSASETRPEEVLVLGTRASQWDCLHELSDSDAEEDVLAGLELGESVRQGDVSREQLDGVEKILSEVLEGTTVRCELIGEASEAEGQFDILRTIAGGMDNGDEVHLDVTHGFRHWGQVGLESLLFLRQVRQIAVGGVYYANFGARNDDGSAPVVRLEAVDAMADWSEALASFRQTGQLGRLPDLFDANYREIARPLEKLRFSLMANRFGHAAHAARQARASLKKLVDDEPTTLASFFAGVLVDELEIFVRPHIADWQLELSRRALESGDYLRAAINAYEAIVSAAIEDSDKRKKGWYRHQVASDTLKAKEQHAHPFRDQQPFWNLSNIRNALAHGGEAQNGYLRKQMRDEKSLRAFLEELLEFAQKYIRKFKVEPPC